MRKHLGKLTLFAVVLTLGASNMFADVSACPSSTTMDQLIGITCYSQDKLYSGFNYQETTGGTLATAVSANLIADSIPGLDIHGWNFGDNWYGTGFTLGYTIQVCTAAPCTITPGAYIFAADMDNAPLSQAPQGVETVTWTPGGQVVLQSGVDGPLGISLNTTGPVTVTAVFAPNTGSITQTTLRFYETVPEPSSMLLLGVFGVVGLGLFRRKTFTA